MSALNSALGGDYTAEIKAVRKNYDLCLLQTVVRGDYRFRDKVLFRKMFDLLTEFLIKVSSLMTRIIVEKKLDISSVEIGAGVMGVLRK